MLLVAFNLSNFVLSVLIISPVFLLLLRFCTFHWIHSVVPDNSATLSTKIQIFGVGPQFSMHVSSTALSLGLSNSGTICQSKHPQL